MFWSFPYTARRSRSAVAIPRPWKRSSTANATSALASESAKYEPTPTMRVSCSLRRETISVSRFWGSRLSHNRSSNSSDAVVAARKRRRREAGDSSLKNRCMASRSDTVAGRTPAVEPSRSTRREVGAGIVGILVRASELHCAGRHERLRLDELVFGMMHRENGTSRDAHDLLGDIAHEKMAHRPSPMGSHHDEVDPFRL